MLRYIAVDDVGNVINPMIVDAWSTEVLPKASDRRCRNSHLQ